MSVCVCVTKKSNFKVLSSGQLQRSYPDPAFAASSGGTGNQTWDLLVVGRMHVCVTHFVNFIYPRYRAFNSIRALRKVEREKKHFLASAKSSLAFITIEILLFSVTLKYQVIFKLLHLSKGQAH